MPFAERDACSPCPPASRPSLALLNDAFVPAWSPVLTSWDQVCFFLHSISHYQDPLTGELKPLFLLTMPVTGLFVVIEALKPMQSLHGENGFHFFGSQLGPCTLHTRQVILCSQQPGDPLLKPPFFRLERTGGSEGQGKKQEDREGGCLASAHGVEKGWAIICLIIKAVFVTHQCEGVEGQSQGHEGTWMTDRKMVPKTVASQYLEPAQENLQAWLV